MNSRLIAAYCALLGAVANVVSFDAGCSSNPPAKTRVGADAGGLRDIEVGVVDSLSGGFAAQGVPLQNTLRVAQTQINQIGILGGRHIQFKVVDDFSDTTQAVGAVGTLLRDGPAGILGPLSSGQVLATQSLTYQQRIVQITASATSTLLSTAQPSHDRYLFRTAPADDFQGGAIAQLVYGGIAPAADGGAAFGGGCRRVSTVNGDDGYGNALNDVVKSRLDSMPGVAFVSADKVPTALGSDYKAIAANIVNSRPDCLVLIVYSNVGAALLRDLKLAISSDASGHDWSKFFVVGSDGEHDSAFIPAGQSDPADPTSPNSTEGCMGTAPDPAPETPEYKAFRNLWQQTFPGAEPDAYTANQFDAALILALAIHQAGTSTEGAKIRDALYQVTNPAGVAFGPTQFVEAVSQISNHIAVKYRGASGATTFDDNGNVAGDYIVWRVNKQPNGTFKFDTIGTIKAADLGAP